MVTIIELYLLVHCVYVTTKGQKDKLTGNHVGAHYSIARAPKSEAQGAHSTSHLIYSIIIHCISTFTSFQLKISVGKAYKGSKNVGSFYNVMVQQS